MMRGRAGEGRAIVRYSLARRQTKTGFTTETKGREKDAPYLPATRKLLLRQLQVRMMMTPPLRVEGRIVHPPRLDSRRPGPGGGFRAATPPPLLLMLLLRPGP
jgi:hypothetical protein